MNMIGFYMHLYNLSNKEMADVLGASESSVSEWQSGKRSIPRYIVNHIDDLMGISKTKNKRIINKRTAK